MHLEEGQLVPITALEGDLAITVREKTAPAKGKGGVPSQCDDITRIADCFADTDHFRSSKFAFKHSVNSFAAFNPFIGDLVIAGIGVVTATKAQRITSAQ